MLNFIKNIVSRMTFPEDAVVVVETNDYWTPVCKFMEDKWYLWQKWEQNTWGKWEIQKCWTTGFGAACTVKFADKPVNNHE